ncbi:MAG TPA: glycoside hydrolase family 2 protein, partial [Polyangiaceae bacterium]|nr:glycoside hydrolase family 2 protein [Polyangiaceae bacterium]
PLVHAVLPALVTEFKGDTVYWPSSAHGGEFPHVCWSGTTSYYGVGAYLRPLEDARRSEVRFASECLAFANVPHPEALPGGPSARVHHPAWKARTPRDLGAGWDFDDVRDHYVERLFGVDTRALRYGDHDRYLELGRAATGEVMAATISEWRRSRSQCRGALIWFLKDLWPSAGWGIFDSSGAPKSVYYYLRRVMQPLFLGFSDEGLNGLSLHAVNETPRALAGEIRVRFFRHFETLSSELAKPLELPAHGARELPLGAWLEGFSDLTYAYRFGPPSVDLVTASLEVDGASRATAFYFPLGFPRERETELGLSARGRALGDGRFEVVVQTKRFAQAVTLNVAGATADDDYFNVAPGATKTIVLTLGEPRPSLRGSVQALNAVAPVPIRFE